MEFVCEFGGKTKSHMSVICPQISMRQLIIRPSSNSMNYLYAASIGAELPPHIFILNPPFVKWNQK